MTASSDKPGPDLTVETMKMAANEFDVEAIVKLCVTKRGLVRITAVDKAVNLVELNLSANLIDKVDGLKTLKRLRKLHLTANKIRRVENLDGLESLEHLYLQANHISRVEELAHLQRLPNLRTLYLKNVDGSQPNPVCTSKGYREKVLAILPDLRNLDGERLRGSEEPRTSTSSEVLTELTSNGVIGGAGQGGRGMTPRQSSGVVGSRESWLKGFDWGEAGWSGAGAGELRGVEALREELAECKAIDARAQAALEDAEHSAGGGRAGSEGGNAGRGVKPRKKSSKN